MRGKTNFDVIFKNAVVVNHDGRGARDIGIIKGRIAALGDLSRAHAGEEVDCTGLHILPGMIDSQVHFREPGLEHKEDLQSGSLSAVLGGVTAVFEMPNTRPATDTPERLADKLRRAHHHMHCDFAFWVGATRANVHLAAELERLPGSAGMKVFMGSSTGDLLLDDDAGVAAVLRQVKRRVAFHSEDEARLAARKRQQIAGDPGSHPVWRDEKAALFSTQRLLRLARKTGARIHILHLSTAEEAEFLRDYKNIATIEVTPHHLTLTAADYARLGTLMQMNPPIRAERHRQALWQALQQGLIDVLGSDHAPHLLSEKQQAYPASPSGMTGVQTIAPLMLDYVNKGLLSLERFVDLTAHGPNRIFGISRKGRIALGYDADFTIIDLKRQGVITNAGTASKAGWTPYDGKKVQGWPVGTIIRGRRVMWEGELVSAHGGEAVEFIEALPHRR
ncbi:MAG: dihydroorotase [Candidatus Tokpelaia sp.]|nr:MAG: dihydroorotase [Candidatus Tokpelaia sp.]KAA6206928.1 MAG: dihydroorotase [Candidatus Tokpelaia sp.]